MNKIAAVIITFNPEEDFLKNIDQIANQCDKVFIIDNNSYDQSFLNNIPNNCCLFKSEINLGLASALNIGILHALSEGYEWVATFDQDSLIPHNYFFEMLVAIDELTNTKLGMICPRYKNPDTGKVKSFVRKSRQNVKSFYKTVPVTMTSGTVTSLKALRQCGLYDDSMFIDQLDNDLCLRLRRAGYLIIEHQKLIINHSVGKVSENNILKLRLRPSNHSALRRYYMARNRIIVYKRHLFYDPIWFMEDLSASLREYIKIILFEEDKKIKCLNIIQGSIDGFMNKLGPWRGND